MKASRFLWLSSLPVLAFTMMFTGCSPDRSKETADPSFFLSPTPRPVATSLQTRLTGEQEVPPVKTEAVGQLAIRISRDDSFIIFGLIVANIENVTAAHLHLAPRGENGPVVVWLYDNPDPQPSGIHNGVLASGVIMEDDIVGLLDKDMDGLIQAIRDGDIYVNVHTMQNPAGEIRGQL